MTPFLKLSATVMLIVPLWGAAVLAQSPAGDAAKGRDLYMKNGCTYCHGTVGQGGGGRTGGLRIVQLNTGFEPFLNQLRNPVNEMPPYVPSVLSDKDVADIFAFVSALPPPPDVKTIPILNN